MATAVLRPAAALALVVLLTGCGAAQPARDGSATPPPGTPAPRTTSPDDLCARIVGHWSREVLNGDAYGDYQSMGLSNGQYEILRAVVDAARAEKRRAGARAADALIDRRAAAGCAELYRTGTPATPGTSGKGPWQ
ncbi:hypothetical protein AB0M97_04660 [Streptomyces sp. NPDC051207]|uniref:hypothetical protein n=1 Tax=Streptomyces sp. NPDC051207 TaxID=3154641 RepID=UPI003446F1B5